MDAPAIPGPFAPSRRVRLAIEANSERSCVVSCERGRTEGDRISHSKGATVLLAWAGSFPSLAQRQRVIGPDGMEAKLLQSEASVPHGSAQSCSADCTSKGGIVGGKTVCGWTESHSHYSSILPRSRLARELGPLALNRKKTMAVVHVHLGGGFTLGIDGKPHSKTKPKEKIKAGSTLTHHKAHLQFNWSVGWRIHNLRYVHTQKKSTLQSSDLPLLALGRRDPWAHRAPCSWGEPLKHTVSMDWLCQITAVGLLF